MCFESDSVVSLNLKWEELEIAVSPDSMSADSHSHPSSEESSDKVIPEDISLPSKFLLPTLDESSSLDQGTMEQELSKSQTEESTEKNDSGANDQIDISSHDEDIISYETK